MSDTPNDPNAPRPPQQPPTPPQQPPQQPPHQSPQQPGGWPSANPYADHGQRGYASPGNAVEDKGFFGALFDFSFRSFVTVSFAKIIYIILIVLIALGWLFYVIAGFAVDPALGFGALLMGWIPGFVMLVLARVMIEFYIAMVRTSQNTAATVAELQALRQESLRR
ncbi:DUF4282 domain-containing protein [Citricoccus sp. GCM10030269]|uniref:DUF4282 domain-containing protein n=1 Tax=Citricoccus sp. GCM10030269 TaxID=3273388 RepID=UPI003622007E